MVIDFFDAIFREASDPVVVLAQDGTVALANHGLRAIVEGAQPGVLFMDLVSEAARARVRRDLVRAAGGEEVLIEVPHPMEGSGDVIVEYRFFPIDDGRTAGLGRVRDGQRALADDLGRTRAELLQKQRILDEIQIELSQVPFIDPVTGVWNRLQVIERLASEWSRSERWNSPIAGMMVEIEGLDGPDEVRQREGNAIADEVLKSVARRIKSVVRDHDIVGRYGDSRFCVVAVQCGARGAANLAGRIAARIDGEPIKAIGRVIPIRVRVGCCTNASSGVEIMEDLFDRSLEALSEARARDEVVHCADEVYD